MSWRIYFVVGVWFAAAIILWPKISKTTVSDTEVAMAMQRATILFQEGKYKEALARLWVIQVPKCFPGRVAQKYHNIGLIQLRLDNPKEAEAALKEAVSYDPKDMDAYYLLAHIAFEAKQYSKAKQYLRDAETQTQNGTSLPKHFRLLKAELEKFQSGL
jgi:tetratricopeptide (TPR) repeat protein